jgi:hypothetical protein
MTNALRSGGFTLHLEDTSTILSFVMNMFNRFINSNEELRLDQGFAVYFKVFSYDHTLWPKSRRKNKAQRTLGCKQTDSEHKIAGCLEIAGFPGEENAFKNQCLLISVIICHFVNEFYQTKDTTFETLKALWSKTKRSSKKKKIEAGQILQREMQHVITSLTLPVDGPYDMATTIPKLCNHFSCQIHVIKSTQEEDANLESFPDEVWQDNVKQIFLFQSNPGHVQPVINLKSYVNQNNQFCLICKKTFTPFYRHLCSYKEKSCFLCNSYFAKEDTLRQENLPFSYCFSKLDPQLSTPIVCEICNYKFPTRRCFTNHKRVCGVKSRRGRIGYFCDTCNKFIKGNSSLKVREDHQCLEKTQKKCRHCKEVFETNEEEHQCILSKEPLTMKWPKLVFFSFEFKNNSTALCTDCHRLRKEFQETRKLNWKETCKHKEFSKIKCSHHKVNLSFQIPNFCTVWRERKLGSFDKFTFSDDDLQMEEGKSKFKFNYDIHDKQQGWGTMKAKMDRKTTPVTHSRLEHLQEKVNKTVEDYFTLFLMSEDVKGSVLLSLNPSNENMAVVMDCLSKLDFMPKIIKKDSNFILVKTKTQNLTFLNASKFFKGNYEDLIRQFRLTIEPHFFPNK